VILAVLGRTSTLPAMAADCQPQRVGKFFLTRVSEAGVVVWLGMGLVIFSIFRQFQTHGI
jgi:hypothetical protein